MVPDYIFGIVQGICRKVMQGNHRKPALGKLDSWYLSHPDALTSQESSKYLKMMLTDAKIHFCFNIRSLKGFFHKYNKF